MCVGRVHAGLELGVEECPGGCSRACHGSVQGFCVCFHEARGPRDGSEWFGLVQGGSMFSWFKMFRVELWCAHRFSVVKG